MERISSKLFKIHSCSSNKYISLIRYAFYSSAVEHVKPLQKIVEAASSKNENENGSILFCASDIEKYTTDWKRAYNGGSVVFLPSSTSQISQVLAYCNANKIGVVPQGGNTSLVGGSVGTHRGELIISMERMNKIESLDSASAIMVAQSGCILENLEVAAEACGLTVPLDLGPKGSCMIGGNISTNAGGKRVVKYGSLQSNILGLEVVLSDGTILDLLRTLHKNNTGYHLKHLFVGAEGTLGIITRMALKLYPKPTFSSVIFVKLSSFNEVPKLLKISREVLGSSLSAFEFMDSLSIASVVHCFPDLFNRLSPSTIPQSNLNDSVSGEINVLVEVQGSNSSEDGGQLLDHYLSVITDKRLIIDAVISKDKKQENSLWSIRENVPVALMNISRETTKLDDQTRRVSKGRLLKYDISIRLDEVSNLLQETKVALAACGFPVKGCSLPAIRDETVTEFSSLYPLCSLEFLNFGHAGDQNLHLNVQLRVVCELEDSAFFVCSSSLLQDKHEKGIKIHFETFCDHVHEALNSHLYSAVIRRNGSISAEHGIGQEKKLILAQTKSAPELHLMKSIKQILDPGNILNPGKVVDI